ncbi:putative Ecdysteroid kinase-containing protein 20 [Homarus americanus]|uniref:Putative Ecdysteroid kinase-containing protein 20 n=1 Tax=Homarus americanus TaxID=6706 RepID=A0A8J5JGN3_HOMAM|nr:putative Ecdysteroid kinase-containing protein 20 [Homarus americanus]
MYTFVMAEEAVIPSYSQVTDEKIQAALTADKGPGAKLVSWQVKDFTKKGDNYACIVTSVIVQYTLEGAQHETTYVAKIGRDMQVASLKTMFRQIVAKCFHCCLDEGKEILLMEDLRARSFRMFDRQRGMDAAHATLVLQELGRLHAASILLDKTLPSHDFTKTWTCLTDDWTTDDENKMFKTMTDHQLDGAAMIMKKIPNYERVVRWIEGIKETAVDIMKQSFRSEDGEGVLLHGDCWNNNVLFSFNGPDRIQNKEMFLKAYYDSFTSVLKTEDVSVPFTPEELQQKLQDHMIYGALVSMFLVPMVLSEAEDVPDLDSITDMDKFSEGQKDVLIKMSERNDSLLKLSSAPANKINPVTHLHGPMAQ